MTTSGYGPGATLRDTTNSPMFVRGHELSPHELYTLLRLRVDVFVVEQACAYPELDGLDLLPSTTHAWVADVNGPTASLRILASGAETNGTEIWKIGRVVTRQDSRGCGLSSKLLRAALDRFGQVQTVLEAQSHLQDYYAKFGFIPAGSEYIEDGIPHVPMSRQPSNQGASS